MFAIRIYSFVFNGPMSHKIVTVLKSSKIKPEYFKCD